LLFDDSILNTIIDSTNKIIEDLIVQRIAEERSVETEHHRLDLNEFKAFLAILYHMALWKSSNVDDNMLWSSENGVSFYRAVMPRKRFSFISNCLRFDDKETRDR